jgi:hypothetical protein
MSNEELQKELESLRSEVATMSKARAAERKKEQKSKVAKETPPPADVSQAEAASVVEAAAIDVNDTDAVQTQMDKLLEQLESEIKDMPAVTTLAVFSLGVLFGRLLH